MTEDSTLEQSGKWWWNFRTNSKVSFTLNISDCSWLSIPMFFKACLVLSRAETKKNREYLKQQSITFMASPKSVTVLPVLRKNNRFYMVALTSQQIEMKAKCYFLTDKRRFFVSQGYILKFLWIYLQQAEQMLQFYWIQDLSYDSNSK